MSKVNHRFLNAVRFWVSYSDKMLKTYIVDILKEQPDQTIDIFDQEVEFEYCGINRRVKNVYLIDNTVEVEYTWCEDREDLEDPDNQEEWPDSQDEYDYNFDWLILAEAITNELADWNGATLEESIKDMEDLFKSILIKMKEEGKS